MLLDFAVPNGALWLPKHGPVTDISFMLCNITVYCEFCSNILLFYFCGVVWREGGWYPSITSSGVWGLNFTGGLMMVIYQITLSSKPKRKRKKEIFHVVRSFLMGIHAWIYLVFHDFLFEQSINSCLISRNFHSPFPPGNNWNLYIHFFQYLFLFCPKEDLSALCIKFLLS